MRQFRNETGRPQVVYDRSRNPIEVAPGGILTGDQWAGSAKPRGPLSELDVVSVPDSPAIPLQVPAIDPQPAEAIDPQPAESQAVAPPAPPIRPRREGGRRAGLNPKTVLPGGKSQ